MAFNPFSTFRKHQRYWMAGAVRVCMLTFVLCGTGMGSKGVDDYILKHFRSRGEDYARVNGRRYTYEDISELKNQRNIANDFMRELTKYGMDKLTDHVKELYAKQQGAEASEQTRQTLAFFDTCLKDMVNKYHRDQR